MYGVGDGLLAAIKAFYKESEACVRVGGRMSEGFSVKSGCTSGLCNVTMVV